MNYIITKEGETLTSAEDVAFLNASANRCSQIDLYIGTNAAGNAIQIDNIVITKTVSEVSHNYTVNAVAGTAVLQELASGIALENAGYSVSVPKVIVNNGNYYVLDAGQDGMNMCLASYTMGTADVTKEITYTLDESIIYFKECEDIQQKNEMETASGGYTCSYYATPQTITITSAGVYQLEANITGRDSNSSLDLYTADGTEAVASFAKNTGTGVKTLYFLADANMRVGGPYYNDKFNNSKSVDYIIVRKIADVTDVSSEFVGAFDFSTSFMDEHKDATIKQGQKVTFTFQNHGNGVENWFNWLLRMSGTTGVDQTLRADNFALGDADSEVSTRAITEDGGLINWNDFKADMKDGAVVLEVSYGYDGMFAAEATATGTSHTYKHTFAYNDAKSGDINLELGVEKAWLEVKSVETTALPVAVTVSSVGYATFCPTVNVDFSAAEDIEACTAEVDAEGNITYTPVTTVAAGEGVLLRTISGGEATEELPVLAEATANENNAFVGIPEKVKLAQSTEAGYTNYILSKVDDVLGFYKVNSNGSWCKAGSAYLKVANAAAHARNFFALSGSETTTIEGVGTEATTSNLYYNLNGQRMAQPAKGIYVVNGKKVIIK